MINETEELFINLQKSFNIYSVTKLAKLLGVSRTIIYTYIKSNKISIKTYKKIKEIAPNFYISQDYIVNNIIGK